MTYIQVRWIGTDIPKVKPHCINEPIRGIMPEHIGCSLPIHGLEWEDNNDVLDAMLHGVGIVLPDTEEVEFL